MLIGDLNNVIKMNVQLLAGEGGEDNPGTGEEPNGGGESNDNNTSGNGAPSDTKTYTQEELDALLNDAKKGLPSEEELTKFKEWQESQKTEAQKQNEKLENEIKAREEAEERASRLEAKVECLSKGVASESVDDVITLAKTMVSDTLTIDKAIDKVLEKYPSFKAGGAETQGFKIGSGGSKDNPKNNINDALAAAFGNK